MGHMPSKSLAELNDTNVLLNNFKHLAYNQKLLKETNLYNLATNYLLVKHSYTTDTSFKYRQP